VPAQTRFAQEALAVGVAPLVLLAELPVEAKAWLT